MATHKPDLSRLSLSQLSELTGFVPRTVKKRLRGLDPVARDGKTLWYSTRDALAKLYLDESLDLTRERARLAKEQADSTALRNAKERGELIDKHGPLRALVALAVGARDRLLAVPTEVAPALAADATVTGCGRIVDDAIRRALHDLADEGERAERELQRAEQRAERKRGNGAEPAAAP